jgi:hypothetical protein
MKAVLLLLGVASLPFVAQAEPPAAQSPITNPSWRQDRLGNVRFSYRRDQRRGEEQFEFRINEDGKITGEDLLQLAHPAEQALYEQVMRQEGRTGDLNKLYHDYLQDLTDRALGLLILNRIIDHEAMKRKVAPEVSDNRVYYVLRALLVRNAIDRRLNPDSGNAALYAALKETVGARPVRFNIDWKYRDGGMAMHLEALNNRSTELEWPPVTLSFMRLPETVQEFEQQLRQKMQPSYRALMRQTVWRVLVQEANPNIMWQSLFAVTTEELSRMYQTLREQAFRVQATSARVSYVAISGPKSAELKARFLAILTQRQTALLNELFGQNPQGAASEAEQTALRERIRELRATVPAQALEEARQELAAAIAAGEVRVDLRDGELEHNGIDAMPTDNSVASQQRRMAFNPMFSSMGLFPKLELIDGDGTVRIMFFRSLEPGAVSYLDQNDRRVEQALRAKIQAKLQGRVFRDLAYRLFRENRYESNVSTCSEIDWPCANTEPRHLAEILFPEVLFPGASLGFDGPNRPVANTLGRSELMDRVFEIKLDLFQRVFEIPNDHVDPELRLRARR